MIGNPIFFCHESFLLFRFASAAGCLCRLSSLQQTFLRAFWQDTVAASSAFGTRSVSLICFSFSASVSKFPLFLAIHIAIAWPSAKQSVKGKTISISKKSHLCPLPDARAVDLVRTQPAEAETEWTNAEGMEPSPLLCSGLSLMPLSPLSE